VSPRSIAPRAALALASLASLGCGTMNLARTLGRGNSEITGSVGGPLLGVGSAVFPVPQARLGVRHGVTDDVDAMGHLALDALGSRALALDVGVVGQMTRTPRGFAMALSARLHVVVDLDDAVAPRVFPEIGLHLEHPLDTWGSFFFGLGGLGQIEAPRDRPFLFLSPYLGLEIFLDPQTNAAGDAVERTGFALQLGWINPWEDARTVVRYVPDGAGAITVLVAVRHRFGGLDR
jgi:hypothetical protein